MESIDSRVAELESLAVDVLLDFLRSQEPEPRLIQQAKVAQGAFATVQRRMSALNQRDALQYMLMRDANPSARITGGS